MRQFLFFCLIFLVVFPGKIWAAAMAAKDQAYELEEIVVTATRADIPRQEAAANITVVTKDDIEKMPVSSAAEVLQYVPGVYVEFSGGLGSVATAAIQGSNVRDVAVYQDGVPINQLAMPRTDLSYLPVTIIERIEIYKGAASSAWGSSLGGVINIITKEPDPKKTVAADIQTSCGEFETSRSRGAVSGTTGSYGYLFSFTRDRSDGFMEHTAYEQDAAYAKFNYDVRGATRLNLVLSYDEGLNEDPVVNFPEFWDDIHRRRSYQRLLCETLPVDNLVLTLEGRHHRFDTRIDDVFSDHKEVFNDYEEETWGGSVRLSHEIPRANRFNLGFDGDWGRYDWVFFAKEYETGNWAAYVNDTLTIGKFSFTAGIRYDDNDRFGSEVSPSAGMVYRISGEKALVRAQVARGFSAPPPSALDDPRFGNPDLDPEIGINYQLGGEVRPFGPLWIEVNLFRSEIEDLINEDPRTNRPENIDEVTRQGVEASIRAAFDFGLTLSIGGSYVDTRDDTTDEVMEDVPRTLYNASASYAGEWMSHSIVGKFIDHNSSFPETRDEVFVFDYLIKVRPPVSDRYGKLSVFGAVHNLTNTSYIYREVFPQPERWIEAGVRLEY